MKSILGNKMSFQGREITHVLYNESITYDVRVNDVTQGHSMHFKVTHMFHIS